MNKLGFCFIENLPELFLNSGFLATMPLFNSKPVIFRKISKFNSNQNLDDIPNKTAAILKKLVILKRVTQISKNICILLMMKI